MRKNSTALVTGGNGGIGQEICKALSNQGCHVVAGYHPADQENAEKWQAAMKEEGFNFSIKAADVSNADSALEMVTQIESEIGPIDVLVNCAGITRDKSIKKMDIEDWDAVIETNLNSAFYVTKPVMMAMMEREYGRIINISSVNGQRGQFGQPNYSAAKAGLHGFTMSAALEGATKGVTVNTISPGYVETPMTSAMPEKVLDAIVSQVPMRRMAKPQEIAFAVAFLADERNAYTTGANIPVNGGLFTSF
ncbi:MAG TPA: acetoacetyl-CoA reductase [Gammaproteobacteria bacterium]|jgi:acetoacetyl-CoA reductase|nr:acetoacetyl-CoA reductase [Gammaproteobacteria bacterium]